MLPKHVHPSDTTAACWVSCNQKLTLYMEPREACEYLQRSRHAVEDAHTLTLTHAHAQGSATCRYTPHPVCLSAHPTTCRDSATQTCTHMDESRDLVIQTHACTCIHTHVQTHTYMHTYTHSISRWAAALAWMLAAGTPSSILT